MANNTAITESMSDDVTPRVGATTKRRCPSRVPFTKGQIEAKSTTDSTDHCVGFAAHQATEENSAFMAQIL
jgi:hypothetical protein